MQAAGLCEQHEVVGIRGEDLIAVLGEHHERGVDDIACMRDSKQGACRSTQSIVERRNENARERAGQACLPGLSAPDLPDDTTMGDRHATGYPLAGEQGHDPAIPALDGDQRPSVENERHAGG